MYQFFIGLYWIGVAIASVLNKKVRKMWEGEHQTFSILKDKLEPGVKYIWFHAASLGEFEQGRPLMEQIRKEHPEYKIVLTFFSPSGYEVRKNYDGADIICYLPLDTLRNAIRFVNMVRPVKVFFIKYEFWYNYLKTLKRHHIPVYSVSSIFRPQQAFFAWYGSLYRRVLSCFDYFFVQNDESKKLLNGIGLENVEVVGDTRFDRVLQIKQASKNLPIIEAFVGDTQKVFIAGSSWMPDEEIFLKFFAEHRDWKIIIAPHVIAEDHLRKIYSLIEGRKVVRYSQSNVDNVSDAEIMIIDCFGLLSSIYKYATVSYVGGGFGVGIHNTLEAAVWNIPVIFGPNNKKFQEAQGLLRHGGGFEIVDFEAFCHVMKAFGSESTLKQASEQAGKYVESLSGATHKILSQIKL